MLIGVGVRKVLVKQVMTGFVFIKGKQVAWVSSILKSKSLNQRANIKKKIFADKEHNQLYEGNYAQ